jgi:hypothetical protein
MSGGAWVASRLEESTAICWGAAWNNENGLISNYLSVSHGIINNYYPNGVDKRIPFYTYMYMCANRRIKNRYMYMYRCTQPFKKDHLRGYQIRHEDRIIMVVSLHIYLCVV